MALSKIKLEATFMDSTLSKRLMDWSSSSKSCFLVEITNVNLSTGLNHFHYHSGMKPRWGWGSTYMEDLTHLINEWQNIPKIQLLGGILHVRGLLYSAREAIVPKKIQIRHLVVLRLVPSLPC